MLVHHDPCEPLPYAARHHTRLAWLYCEAFFDSDRRHLDWKPICHAQELCATGECKIVGIACVIRVQGTRERRKSRIETERTQVGERRRGRSALRQMSRAKPLLFEPVEFPAQIRRGQLTTGNTVGYQSRHRTRYRSGVAKRTKNRVDPRLCHRDKEIGKIKPDDELLTHVR